MKLVGAGLLPYRLPLRRALVTAHGTSGERCGWLVRLDAADGASGWGEASPLPGFGLESPRACRAALERLLNSMVGEGVADLGDALDRLEQREPSAPAARAALDCALHDLHARRRGVSVARVLAEQWLAGEGSPATGQRIPVNALVAGGELPTLVAAAREALEAGYGTLKLKLGYCTLIRDLARVRAVAELCTGGQRLRLDVNGAWTEAQAGVALAALEGLPIEWLEQPLPAGNLAGMARLRARGPLPLAADEAVAGLSGARRIIDQGAADWLVLKPAAVGGLRSACRIARAAWQAGLGCAATGFLDSALGLSAALQLAAVLAAAAPPGRSAAAGLATAQLLASDLFPAPPIVGGAMYLPAAPGLGLASLRPDPDRLGPAWELSACR